MTYAEKLKDPRWQKKRLEILERDQWQCQDCGDSSKTLQVHHHWYSKGKSPWDYPNSAFQALCERCHKEKEEFLLELRKEFSRAPRTARSLRNVCVISEVMSSPWLQDVIVAMYDMTCCLGDPDAYAEGLRSRNDFSDEEFKKAMGDFFEAGASASAQKTQFAVIKAASLFSLAWTADWISDNFPSEE